MRGVAIDAAHRLAAPAWRVGEVVDPLVSGANVVRPRGSPAVIWAALLEARGGA